MDASSIDRSHAAWPVGLRDLPGSFPRELRVRGTLPARDAPGVAIVGSREASPAGIALARAWARVLSERGHVIWSGGAVGIDAAAHEGALDAGGATVAVLGGGLDRPSPRANVDLFRRIVASGRGAVVSCVADDTPAARHHFLHRNGVIAACSTALLVVEAGVVSGARSAAAAARRISRPVGVVGFGPGGPPPDGNVAELTEREVHVVYTVEHVDRLARTGSCAPPRTREDGGGATVEDAAARPPDPTDPAQRQVLDLLRHDPRHVDAICEVTGRMASEVGRVLFVLAVEGHVREVTPGVWGAA